MILSSSMILIALATVENDRPVEFESWMVDVIGSRDAHIWFRGIAFYRFENLYPLLP